MTKPDWLSLGLDWMKAEKLYLDGPYRPGQIEPVSVWDKFEEKVKVEHCVENGKKVTYINFTVVKTEKKEKKS